MTDERIAIEWLARCRFLPGTSAKRIARSLNDRPEEYILTAKQRACLHNLLKSYRRQLPEAVRAWNDSYFDMPSEQQGFENALDSAPADVALACIYADWLEERGQTQLAMAYRWAAQVADLPRLTNAGMVSGPKGSYPINFEWTIGMKCWEIIRHVPTHGSPSYWFRSRQKAMGYLSEVVLDVMAAK